MNSTQSQSARGATRSAAIPFGVTAVSIALVSIVAFVAFGGFGGRANSAVVPPPAASPSAPAATPKPTGQATQAPAPTPKPVPTPEAIDAGSDAMPIRVVLANATGADIYVDIVDHTGLLTGARSGTPGDGVSVADHTIDVENLDPQTLKLTWMDFPIDNALALYVDRFDGKVRLVLVQPAPTGDTDAIAFDRELVLTFSEPISASQVETFLQDGLDTPG